MLSAAVQLILSLAVLVTGASLVGILTSNLWLSCLAGLAAGGATFAFLEHLENVALDSPHAFVSAAHPRLVAKTIGLMLEQREQYAHPWSKVEIDSDDSLVGAIVHFSEPTTLRDPELSNSRLVELKVRLEPVNEGTRVQLKFDVHSPGNRMAVNSLIRSTTARLHKQLTRKPVSEPVLIAGTSSLDLQETA